MATVLETPKIIPLGPRDAGQPFTPDEFESSAFEDGYRYELIRGVLVVSPAPLEEERDANEQLGYWLRTYQDHHPQGHAQDLTLPEHNLRTRSSNRRCDRAIWAGLGRPPQTRGPVARRAVPVIVVEFTSSRPADQRRDYGEKVIEYRDLGVQEYWIIDRFRRAMTVYFWRSARWSKRTLGAGDRYATKLLPGFELPLADLFRVCDRYGG